MSDLRDNAVAAAKIGITEEFYNGLLEVRRRLLAGELKHRERLFYR